MNIQTKQHSKNQVIISTEDFKRLVEIAEKIEPIEVSFDETKSSADDLEMREEAFAKKLLAEGFISKIPPRDETDEEDDFEPIEFDGEPLSETIIRERR